MTTIPTAQSTEHPLLTNTLPTPWHQFTNDAIQKDIPFAIQEAEKAIAHICQLKDNLSFGNTLLAFEHALETLSLGWGRVNLLNNTCQTPELRATYNDLLPKVTDFFSKLHLNEALWQVIKRYQSTSEAKQLTGIQKRFLEEVVADFTLSGADLPKAEKEELIALDQQLAQLTHKFGEHVLDATNAWSLIVEDETRLAGLPESIKQIAQQQAATDHPERKTPAWKLTLHAPCAGPCMRYLENEDLRKEIWEASSSIGRKEPYQNQALIIQILNLRQQKARLLGKMNYADMVLERRMAKNGSNALRFINTLHDRIEAAFKKDIETLETFKAQTVKTPASKLQPWEASYWAEKLKQTHYRFDEEALRPYFPLPTVLEGIFKIIEKLYQVRIVEQPTEYLSKPTEKTSKIPVWHSEVRYYEIFEHNGQRLGGFYTDWHPRASKQSGAWMDPLYTADRSQQNNQEPHMAVVCGNMTPSLAGQPALLSPHEVETIFHEFGHMLHHIFGKVSIRSLNGTHVAWDFVEFPSHIFENWFWQPECMQLFAKHHQTQQPIPEALLKQFLASRFFLEGMAFMRQLSLAKIDLELHTQTQQGTLTPDNLDTFVSKTLESYLPQWKSPAPFILCQFNHIFEGGYAAGYYSYKWAEAHDADAFMNQFAKKGILNPVVGQQFKQKVLEKGNSAEPEQLFRDFMGRDLDPDAILERCHLLTTQSSHK